MIEFLRKIKSGQKLKIRQRMMLIVLSIGIMTLLISSVISFYGMTGSKNMAIATGDEIGKESSKNSSKILEEQTKNELTKLAEDKAGDINHRLNDLANEVESMAAEMAKIRENPSRFIPHQVKNPDEIQIGGIEFYIQHAEDFDRANFAEDVALTANMEDFLIGVVERNSMINSIFVTSKENYTLSADDYRKTTAEEFKPPNLFYDALSRDWYKKAVDEQKLIFTNVREYIFSKKLGLFCAAPCYLDNELIGVACAQATLERINEIIKEVELHNNGFCFVVDNRGYIILNSSEEVPKELAVDFNNDIRNSENEKLSLLAKEMTSGQIGISEIDLNGKNYYVAYAPIERTNWAFGAAISKAEVLAT